MEETNNIPQWTYNLNEGIKLKYSIDIDKINSSYNNNFVKSIKMSPTGYSFIFSTEDGMVHYVNLSTVDFWGSQQESEEEKPSLISLTPSYSFSHTELVYSMDW